jgi:hypothetical protein
MTLFPAFRAFRGPALAASLAIVAACGGNNSSSSTTPSAARTTESFSGTVPLGGSAFHSFRVSATGQTEVTLTAASPPATVVMGVALGTVDDAGCTPLAGGMVNTPAGSSPQLAGLTSAATLCVQIKDVGSQTGPVTYSVSVTHP